MNTRSSPPARKRADRRALRLVGRPEAVDVLVWAHEPEVLPGQGFQVSRIASEARDLRSQGGVLLQPSHGGRAQPLALAAERHVAGDALRTPQQSGGDGGDRDDEPDRQRRVRTSPPHAGDRYRKPCEVAMLPW